MVQVPGIYDDDSTRRLRAAFFLLIERALCVGLEGCEGCSNGIQWLYGAMHTTRYAEGLRRRHLLVPGSRLGCWRGLILHTLIVDAVELTMRNASQETRGWSFSVPVVVI